MQQGLEPEVRHGFDRKELELRDHHPIQSPLSEQGEPAGSQKSRGRHHRPKRDGVPDERDFVDWEPREARV